MPTTTPVIVQITNQPLRQSLALIATDIADAAAAIDARNYGQAQIALRSAIESLPSEETYGAWPIAMQSDGLYRAGDLTTTLLESVCGDLEGALAHIVDTDYGFAADAVSLAQQKLPSDEQEVWPARKHFALDPRSTLDAGFYLDYAHAEFVTE